MAEGLENKIIGSENTRRDFIKKGLIMATAMSIPDVFAEQQEEFRRYDPEYEFPRAVEAEKNPKIRRVWEIWHSPKKGRGKAFYDMAESVKNNFWFKAYGQTAMENSHVLYILEAKFGKSQDSVEYGNNHLQNINRGLNVFSIGCRTFYEDKNMNLSKKQFANGIFFSVDLSLQDKLDLVELSKYQKARDNLRNERRFRWGMGDYFEFADVEKKEEVLQYLINKGLTDKEKLNVYWNLGFYLASEARRGIKWARDRAIEMRNSKDSSYVQLGKQSKDFTPHHQNYNTFDYRMYI